MFRIRLYDENGILKTVTTISGDASAITYTPTTLSDWDSDVDPGDADDALDQIAERIDDIEQAAVLKALFDANTILAADSDDTPAALTVGEDTIVGRSSGGNIDDLSPTDARAILNVEDNAAADQDASEVDTNVGGFAGNLSGADDTVQKALDTIDDLSLGGGSIDELDEIDSAAQGDIIIRDGSDWDNISIAEQRIVGRLTGEDVKGMTPAEVRTLINVEDDADVTDATNVAAAGAVMDSDISEAEGFLRKTGAGAYEAIKSNLSASAAPGATDDSGEGYAVGSKWIDTTADKAYVCLDATEDAAVWTETTQSGGGGSGDTVATLYVNATDESGGGTDQSIGGGFSAIRIASGDGCRTPIAIPEDFASLDSLVLFLFADATETVQFDVTATWGADDEQYNENSNSVTNVTKSVTQFDLYEYDITSLVSGIVAGEWLGIQIVSDITYVWWIGIRFQYTPS